MYLINHLMNEIKCPKCHDDYHPEHYPHDCEAIEEHGACVSCLGHCPYCKYNIIDIKDPSFSQHTHHIEEFLEDWNNDMGTHYLTIEEFNAGEEYHEIKENAEIE